MGIEVKYVQERLSNYSSNIYLINTVCAMHLISELTCTNTECIYLGWLLIPSSVVTHLFICIYFTFFKILFYCFYCSFLFFFFTIKAQWVTVVVFKDCVHKIMKKKNIYK